MPGSHRSSKFAGNSQTQPIDTSSIHTRSGGTVASLIERFKRMTNLGNVTAVRGSAVLQAGNKPLWIAIKQSLPKTTWNFQSCCYCETSESKLLYFSSFGTSFAIKLCKSSFASAIGSHHLETSEIFGRACDRLHVNECSCRASPRRMPSR